MVRRAFISQDVLYIVNVGSGVYYRYDDVECKHLKAAVIRRALAEGIIEDFK